MDQTLAFVTALLVLVGLVGAVGFLFLKTLKSEQAKQAPRTKDKGADGVEDDEGESSTGARRGGAADRMRARLRQRAQASQQAAAAAAARPANANAQASDSEGGSEGSGDESDSGPAEPGSKKERARQARREAREAERLAREAKEGKRNLYDEKRRKKEEEREAREKAQEEEIQRAAAERKAKEDEEAAKWLGMISVDKEGTGEAEVQEESQGLLAQFIDYIKGRKMVPLEQLAVEFKLRTTEVIDRINGLEAMGRLTGVMDERGKFIYISTEEMQAVANFITATGRVKISDLAAKSNTFIDLEAKAAAAVASEARPAMDFDSLLGADEQ